MGLWRPQEGEMLGGRVCGPDDSRGSTQPFPGLLLLLSHRMQRLMVGYFPRGAGVSMERGWDLLCSDLYLFWGYSSERIWSLL